MPNERKFQIAKILMSSNKTMKVSELAALIAMSEKSVRNTLSDVDSLVTDYDLKLVRKPGSGLSILGSDMNKLRFLTVNKPLGESRHEVTAKVRQLIIIDRLLNDNSEKLTVGSLEDLFYLSSPSVYKDLEEVKSWFLANDIEVTTSKQKGIYIKGGEKRIRHALFDLLIAKEQFGEKEMLVNGNPSAYTDMISDFVKAAFGVLSPEFYRYTLKIVETIESEFKVKYVAGHLNRLIKCLFVAFWRITNNCYCTMRLEAIKELSTLPLFSSMENILKEIEKTFEIRLTEHEIFYIFGIIISAKTNNEIEMCTSEQSLKTNQIIANKICDTVSAAYHIHQKDKYLSDLMRQICSTTNKINYGLDFYNPLEMDICEKFPQLMHVGELAVKYINDAYQFTVPRGESCYIVLLTAAAIEREMVELKLAIVYEYYALEIQYMVQKIISNIAHVNVVGLYPRHRVGEIDFSEVDLVITTNPIDFSNEVNTAILPVIPTKEDVLALYKYVSQLNCRRSESLYSKL